MGAGYKVMWFLIGFLAFPFLISTYFKLLICCDSKSSATPDNALEHSHAGDVSAPSALKGSSSAAVTPPPSLDYSGQDTVRVPEAKA